MNVHELTLQNYTAASGCPSACQPILYLGTAGSYGNEQINVVLGEGWQGLTVKAVFQPSGVPAVVPNGGGVISVPWEATQSVVAYPKGRISFQGYSSGRLVNTSDVYYTVGGSSAGTHNTPAPTPDEFQQFVDAVKSDADRAAQAAADAEAAVQDVKDAGAQAVTDIGNAKDSALEAIDAAREEAAGSISADVEGAKQAAADAEQSAADAEQSAKDAAGALANVQAAGKSALDDIATERQNTLSDIQNEGAKQQSAVAGAGTAALEAIGQTEQAAINQVKQAGETQAAAVQSAGTTQISQINSAGAAQVQAVKDAGAAQVQAVKDEGEAQTSALDDAAAAHKTELESIASHPPQPNTETGKWQVWNAETGAYQDTDALYQGGYYTASVSDDGTLTWQGSQEGMPELPSVNIKGPKGDKGDPGLGVPSPTQSDAGKVPTVKADGSAYELAGPYAPLSAAIRPTANGNPVSITDSVEWPLLGLKVYGKSTQVTTTGAQLLNAENKIQTINGVTMNCDGGIAHFTGELTSPDATFWFIGKYYGSDVVFTLPQGEYFLSDCKMWDDSHANFSGKVVVPEDGMNVTGVSYTVSQTGAIDFVLYPMINAGSTAKPWEPYTGGQPSPSPDYPQEIHSAGESGSITVTVTDGADQSQSLTISTPNGLPGIPVDSGGNYTDASGQQWVCDEVNDSKHVHRIEQIEFDGSPDESWQIAFNENAQRNFFYIALKKMALRNSTGNNVLICSSYKYYQYGYNNPGANNTVCFQSNNLTFVCTTSSFTSVDEWRQFLTENAMTLIYAIADPIETPLSEEEIAAYRALHTYPGTTVVSTAEDVAGLEVKYIADAQKYIDDRLTAAESHIQEIAAAQLNAQTGG